MTDSENVDGGYFSLPPGGGEAHTPGSVHSDTSSLQLPSAPSATMVALTAMQYLPVPILVLSSEATVMIANEAMGRLLGIDFEATAVEGLTVTEALLGKSMGELGIDIILENGSPMLISWDVRIVRCITCSCNHGCRVQVLT